VSSPQRMSKQRKAVLDNLESHSTFRSAQEIHGSMENAGETAGLATVYRNLQVLEDSGLVDAIRGESGEMLYRSCTPGSHHHHLICTRCGRAEEVELDGLEQIMQDLAQSHGFELLDHTVELAGLCEQCRGLEEGEQ
jgi:Fur family ferric uptake transcriptional regulator